MPWDAKTNTGRMQVGAVFAVLDTPQGAGMTPQPPSTGSRIGVDLGGGTNPLSSTVPYGWWDDAVWALPDKSHWRLTPWEPGDGQRDPPPTGMKSLYWTVRAASSAAEAAALVAAKAAPATQ